MDVPALPAWLADLPARLADAVGADELANATRPPDGLGIGRQLLPATIWVGLDRFDAAVPGVVLSLDVPVDARALCAAWGIERPIGVSGDVHQATWSVFLAGAELPAPHRPVVAAEPLRAGRWRLRPRLTGRPAGPLPERSAGASPAYDLLERGGQVASIEVELDARPTDLRRGDDPGVRLLLATMARTFPLWGGGWEVAPDADVVVALEGDRPAAGAVIRDGGGGLFAASRVSVLPGVATAATGSALIDALEAVTLGRGGRQLRFDGSAFLHPDAIRVARHGYAVGPPYDGDADVPVWAQRDLRDRGMSASPGARRP